MLLRPSCRATAKQYLNFKSCQCYQLNEAEARLLSHSKHFESAFLH